MTNSIPRLVDALQAAMGSKARGLRSDVHIPRRCLKNVRRLLRVALLDAQNQSRWQQGAADTVRAQRMDARRHQLMEAMRGESGRAGVRLLCKKRRGLVQQSVQRRSGHQGVLRGARKVLGSSNNIGGPNQNHKEPTLNHTQRTLRNTKRKVPRTERKYYNLHNQTDRKHQTERGGNHMKHKPNHTHPKPSHTYQTRSQTQQQLNHTGRNLKHTKLQPNHTGRNLKHMKLRPNHTGRNLNHTKLKPNHTGPIHPERTAGGNITKRHRKPDMKSLEKQRTGFEDVGNMCMSDVRDNDGKTCKFISFTVCAGTRNATVQTLIGDQGIAATGRYHKCLKPRGSCAVVGSSMHLLDAEFGKAIDSHDVVIRINNAISGTYRGSLAKHVGYRTDVRFINGFGKFPVTDQTEQVCHFLHEPDIGCGETCWRSPNLCNKTCNVGNANITCGFLHPQKEKKEIKPGPRNPRIVDHADALMANALLGVVGSHSGLKYPTAGFKAFAFALRTCDTVTIFGMGPTCNGTLGVRYYSMGNSFPPRRKQHLYDEEYALLRKISGLGRDSGRLAELRPWIRSRNITMQLPDCLLPSVVEEHG